LLAEFDGPEALARAVRAFGGARIPGLDAHTPYSTEVVRDALGLPESRLSPWVFGGGVIGAAGAYALEWFLVAHLYPLNVGGRPPHFPLGFVPIAFEMGVLLAAFAGFFGSLAAGRLVKLWDPVFECEGFESASQDGFWLRLGGEALVRAAPDVEGRLRELGARRVQRVEASA
jgi:hypothetical protein